MSSGEFQLNLNFSQLLKLVMQLPAKEKKKLIGLLKEEQEQGIQIPEEHQNIVRERISKYGNKPDDLIDWDDVQNSIKTD